MNAKAMIPLIDIVFLSLGSLLGVMSQMVAVMSKRNVVEERSHILADDLLITPELGDVKTGDFTKIDVAIAAGETAARQHEAELRAFAVSESEYESFLGRQRREGGGERSAGAGSSRA